MIDSSGRLFGKVNVFDALALGLVALVGLGMVMVQSGCHRTSGQKVQGEAEIQYTVLLRNLKTLNPNLFKPKEKLSITIRNQPRGQVAIVSSAYAPKKTVIPMSNGGYKVVDDPADANGYDYRVTLRDHALVTPDGYVTEGIKVKIGLPIEVEGFNYRVNGVIVDVKPAS